MTSRRPLVIVAGQVRQLPSGDSLDSGQLAHGTSFPLSPATNELFFRDDLGALCQYDGTRWLGPRQRVTPFLMRAAGPAWSTNGDTYFIYLPACRIVAELTSYYVSTTNNASNYWSIAHKIGSTAFLTKSSAASAANTAYNITDTTENLVTGGGQYTVTLTKTGSPGTISAYANLDVQLIYT